MSLLKRLTILAVGLGLAPAAAQAAGETGWERSAQAAVRLVSATAGVGGLDRAQLGLEFSLAPGWKTYWRSPGEGGLPVEIDWSGSQNLKATALAWPAPRRFTVFGIDNIGYADHVLLPIEAELERAGEPVLAKATLTYLVCKEICIPVETRLELPLAAAAPEPTAHSATIARFRAQVPGDGRGAGLAFATAAVEVGDRSVLEAAFAALDPFVAPDLFVEGPKSVHFGAPSLRLEDGGRRAVFRLMAQDATGLGPAAELAGAPLRLTLVDGARSMEATVTPASGAGVSLALMLLFAVLGGAILNLMPCVLPVLSLKLMGVLSLGGAAREDVRVKFLATAAGILASMWALGLVAIAGRTLGVSVGWGVQFQQPVFVAGMATLLTLFAANLFGWFEIALPQPLATRAVGLIDKRTQPIVESFLGGVFATLLATPCTAPFLGPALGFAVSRGALEVALIFTALGIGFAVPYLAVAAFPRLAAHLPRPGAWMVRLKIGLGFGLLGTAVWLLWVLAAQLSPAAAVLSGALMALAAGLLWLRPRWGALARIDALRDLRALLPPAQRYTPAAAIGLALVALAAPAAWPAGTGFAPDGSGVIAWRPFAESEIAPAVARGEIVFVDVTADWCVTCLVNKRLVLQREEVAARLNAKGAIAMQADWTRPDAAIAAYLTRNRRYGIPFNKVYGPGAPAGVILPEVLTVAAVNAALTQAARR